MPSTVPGTSSSPPLTSPLFSPSPLKKVASPLVLPALAMKLTEQIFLFCKIFSIVDVIFGFSFATLAVIFGTVSNFGGYNVVCGYRGGRREGRMRGGRGIRSVFKDMWVVDPTNACMSLGPKTT
ncbi:hypothetical protein Lal_00015827 [Lupinus albus]|nr:hypothetical protein Lal_00015827 [Lupinus albus]